MAETMISVRNLRKRFGPIVAVDDISFEVNKGEVLGLLGPNGAGKSTTIRMITSFLQPDSGQASVCGHDTIRRSIERDGRTRYQISQDSGVDQAVIGRFVRGERNLNLVTAERLCVVFGLELRPKRKR